MPISPNGWKKVFREEDIRPPGKPPTKRMLIEMWYGRHVDQRAYYKQRMSKKVFARLLDWHTECLKEAMKDG